MPGMSSPARAARSPRGRSTQFNALLTAYAQTTRQPLYVLLFLFPILATYEFGALILRPATMPERDLVAQSLIQTALSFLGATGYLVPGLLLMLTLLIWHILSGRNWSVQGWVFPFMLVESVLLTLPLFVLGRLALQAETTVSLRNQVVLALGAGIYEEMVFRLLLVTGLMLLFEEVANLPRKVAGAAAIVLAALVFAACHVLPIGAEPFAWPIFLMRSAAGAYLALVFLTRGLGISVGCHAAYNLILLLF